MPDRHVILTMFTFCHSPPAPLRPKTVHKSFPPQTFEGFNTFSDFAYCKVFKVICIVQLGLRKFCGQNKIQGHVGLNKNLK